MNVTLRQLRAFFAVAEHQSFKGGAEDVGLSQSAVSLSVRQLESELGLRLLDRTTRHVQATAAGATLAASGSRLVEELDAILAELRDVGVQHRGRVKIACVPTVARKLMPRCVMHCAREWPQVTISIEDSSAVEVIRKVGRGDVEIGIASGNITDPALHLEALMEDPFCLVGRRDDPIAAGGSIAWADLAGRRLVMLNNTSGSRQIIEAALERTHTRVEIVLELAQPSAILGMVEGGVGIAIIPELAAPRRDDDVLATWHLVEPRVTRTILLLRRRDRSLSPAGAAVWAALRDVYGAPDKHAE